MSQTNESATVSKSEIFSELNKVYSGRNYLSSGLQCRAACVRSYSSVKRLLQKSTRENKEQVVEVRYSDARVRPCLVRKNFQDSPSHRIFGRMHGVLNIDKNKN